MKLFMPPINPNARSLPDSKAILDNTSGTRNKLPNLPQLLHQPLTKSVKTETFFDSLIGKLMNKYLRKFVYNDAFYRERNQSTNKLSPIPNKVSLAA